MRLTIIAVLVGLAAPSLAHNIRIEHHEVPLEIGTQGRFQQNRTIFMWMPFDSTREVWDLTQYPGGNYARVGIDDYTEGREPAPDSMEQDPPPPDVCEFDTLGSGSIQWAYLYKDDFGLYFDGIDFSQATYRFIGNYRPDATVYSTPVYYRAGWMSAVQWQYEILPGIYYVANEQHIKRVSAKGKVKVPMSGEYFWPCLVVKDYMVFTDNLGSNERRWIYEWLVPGHFLGANGVAAAMSQNGASEDFINVEQMFKLETCDVPDWDLIPPTFANTTAWPDTDYTGPFLVGSDITDDQELGAESLFYRVNQGEWVGIGPDSATNATFWFQVPAVTPPARIDYYVWAKDLFSVEESVDIWTTWPVCSPESTMTTFNVTHVGVNEKNSKPKALAALTVSPNPFGPGTRFTLANPGADRAAVAIYASTGELVSLLNLTQTGSGALAASWDGSDRNGSRLPSGTYFFRLALPDGTRTGKLLLRN